MRSTHGKRPGAADGDAIPNHRVGLKVMSGASAGAITAAIGTVAFAEAGVTPGEHVKDGFTYRYYLPRLYEAWVVRPTLVAETTGVTDFLSLTDLDARPTPADDFSRTSGIEGADKNDPVIVTSLLNSRLLDEIAKAAIDVKLITATPRAYISQTLHVYLTLSNLRGVPYQVPFDGGNYHMISHGDRVHYALKGVGAWPTTSAFADADKKREMDVAWLATGDAKQKAYWKDYSICALASSAFPVGLSPREIGAMLGANTADNEYDGRLFPSEDIVDDADITPSWSQSVLTHKPFWFTCADGGIIDNDPFEYARFPLKEAGKLDEHIVAALDSVDRAVIMISPLPEEKPILPEGEPGMDVVSLFSALMPALINQARFKLSELALAADETHGSRYLIGPSRVVNGKTQRYGIVSGLLGGFGGFVARSFRDHDFQLGRRNCQRFLQTNFALPEVSAIINAWPAAVDRKKYEALPSAAGGQNAPANYCLIPLFGAARDEVELPKWPRISQGDFETLQDRIAQRFDRLAPLLLQQNVRAS